MKTEVDWSTSSVKAMKASVSTTVVDDALDNQVILIDAHLVVTKMRDHLMRRWYLSGCDEVRKHVHLDLGLGVTAAQGRIAVLARARVDVTAEVINGEQLLSGSPRRIDFR